MSYPIDALMYALDVNPDISTEGRVLFLRAQAHAALEHFEGRLVCQQTWKPKANLLQAAGHRVEREVHGFFDLVLVLPDPQRDLMVADLARAHDHLAPGGVLMAAVHNDAGSKRCEQYLREVAGTIDSLSKHHSRAFWATKQEGKPWKADLLERWRQGAAMRRILDGRFWSRPGLFNWDRIDEGSALLAKHLPDTIAGNVADFGCGWGFLSDHILRTCHDIDTLDIYDADGDCFECARRNLGLVPTKVKAHPHWQDITTGFERTKFDTVVMNPPFHEGKEADPLIGLKFIAAAAQALRPDGQLWLVANRQLPYENLLTEAFSQMDKIVETGGFKVLHAQNPIVQPTYVRRGKRRR